MKEVTGYSQIQEVIATQVNKTRSVDLAPEEIGLDLFFEVVQAYHQKFGYIPASWKKYMEARIKYTKILCSEGLELDELQYFSLIELRDKCSEYEYIETKTATASGGVSIQRHKLAA